MPTYKLSFSNVTLNKIKKEKIAKIITNVHNEVTGANTYFAQVIFKKNKKNDHFMGGKIVKEKQFYLNGQIRAGRSSSVKKKLITTLRDKIIELTKVKKENLWIYILDLKPEQMIEYGEILPKAGGEKRWFSKLPKSLKIKLRKLEHY